MSEDAPIWQDHNVKAKLIIELRCFNCKQVLSETISRKAQSVICHRCGVAHNVTLSGYASIQANWSGSASVEV